MHTMLNKLDLTVFRQANRHRIPQFKNAQGLPAHSQPDGSDWSLGDWVNATLGEMGEASNLLKKIRRGDYTLEHIRPELAKELADVITYLDILAMQVNVDLTCMHEFDVQLCRQDRVVLKMTTNFGRASELFEQMEMAREAGETMDEHDMDLFRRHITFYFHEIVSALQELAKMVDVNLGQATIDKFNEVSIRVGSTIRLSENAYEDIAL
jgi:NTP pyrophosphatase (non-canonical NTP hydrolase)